MCWADMTVSLLRSDEAGLGEECFWGRSYDTCWPASALLVRLVGSSTCMARITVAKF